VNSFEDLGIAPELVEALAAEGIESPTPLQESAIPMLRKGNNLVLEAGPGSGLLVSWATGLLDHIEPSGAGRILVVCASTEVADRLAGALAPVAAATGHSVAALDSSWALPERADVLFGGAVEVIGALRAGSVSADAIAAVVFDQAQHFEGPDALGVVEQVLDYVPDEAQRVLSALPMTPAVTSLVERLFKRTMTLPAPAVDVAKRGEVRFRIAPEPREDAALRVVDELLAGGARHALVYCRSADRAADVGDHLTLHGFTAGAPGDASVPVWLGIDALEARAASKGTEGLVVVSCDVPTDPDMLDRRHSIGEDNVVIVLPREVAHLRALGRRTGYQTVPFPPPPRRNTEVDELRSTIENAIEVLDTGPYLLALEPLFERYDPSEVAAAVVALMRSRPPDAVSDSTSASQSPPAPRTAAARAASVPAWSKLFLSVGERDGLRVGDLLGAITGEAGVPGESVGKIDIHESHSLVEVHEPVARQVIQAINGTTIKGRSVRVDFDRPRATSKPRR